MERGLIKGIFAIAIFAALVSIGLKFVFIAKGMNSDGKVYEITVNSYDGPESYFAKGYEKDTETGCIKFKDEFGIKRIVCNNYTITEY